MEREKENFYVEMWKQIQETVQKSMPVSAYDTWIATLDFDKIDLDTIYMTAPTRFIADWVKKNFFSSLLMSIKSIAPQINDIVINVKTNIVEQKATLDQVKIVKQEVLNFESHSYTNSVVSKKYTFENFAVGDSNSLAVASIKRIVTEKSVSFNPLFIHSCSGFGKTHLLNALANDLEVLGDSRRIILTSADKFMYSFVKAIREKDTYRFKESFKAADILIIDDFHFIAGKDSTSREMFHIIEDFIISGKQVIVASNASPFLIEGLDANLKSRISGGLVVDILPADFNLRLNIINLKCESLDIKLDDGIADFIASKLTSNIREIDGALNRILAHSILMKETPSLGNIRKILSDILIVNTKRVSITDIKKFVAERLSVSLSDMDSERKTKDIVVPRQIAMYLSKMLTQKSLPEIGRNFGGREHATVIHAVKKIKDMMTVNPKIESLVADLEKAISAI